jgi:hypothetical protein
MTKRLIGLMALAAILIAAPHTLMAAAVMVDNKAEAPKYLGGIPLPYEGQGAVLYEKDGAEWAFSVKMEEGSETEELGWSYEASGVVPNYKLHFQGNFTAWEEGSLVFVRVEDAVKGFAVDLVFAYSEQLFYGTRLVESNGRGFARDATRPQGQPDGPGQSGPVLRDVKDCPGGKCSCSGERGCEACCPDGTRATCVCDIPTSCKCLERRRSEDASPLLEVVYEVAPLNG